MNNNKIHTEKNKSKKIIIEPRKQENTRMKNKSYNFNHFKLNLIDYLFMSSYKKKNQAYNLFRIGILIYKEKLDVIHLFNCISFIEKRCNFGEDYAK